MRIMVARVIAIPSWCPRGSPSVVHGDQETRLQTKNGIRAEGYSSDAWRRRGASNQSLSLKRTVIFVVASSGTPLRFAGEYLDCRTTSVAAAFKERCGDRTT